MSANFDALMSAQNPFFLAAFGTDFTYRQGGGATPPTEDDDRTIKCVPVQDAESYGQAGIDNFGQLILEVSSRNDTEGVQEIHHKMPNRDQFIDEDGKTWFVVELLQDGIQTGAGFHVIRLKDKDTD